jgi:ABC-type polar amino acid transport system ATPase subunit
VIRVIGAAELFLTLKNQGVTMLITSHDLDFVSAVADRIIVLNDAAVIKALYN